MLLPCSNFLSSKYLHFLQAVWFFIEVSLFKVHEQSRSCRNKWLQILPHHWDISRRTTTFHWFAFIHLYFIAWTIVLHSNLMPKIWNACFTIVCLKHMFFIVCIISYLLKTAKAQSWNRFCETRLLLVLICILIFIEITKRMHNSW